MIKGDLKSAWINPHPSGSDALLQCRRHRPKLHALRTCPWHSHSDRPLSAQVPVNTSFRQASSDNLCCVHLLDPSSFNTVHYEFWLSGVSVSSRCSWNHSRCSQPVINPTQCCRLVTNLSRCCRPVVFLAQQGRWLKSHSFATFIANLELLAT